MSPTDCLSVNDLARWTPVDKEDQGTVDQRKKYFIRAEAVVDGTTIWTDIELNHKPPLWARSVITKMIQLLSLKHNWDSYDAMPIQHKAIRYAIGLVLPLSNTDTPAPSVVPSASGGVQLEWHCNGHDLEIAFDEKGSGSYYYDGPLGEQENEGLLPKIEPQFATLIEALTD